MRNSLVRFLTVALLTVVMAIPVAADSSRADDGELEAFVTQMTGNAVIPPVLTRGFGVASFWHTIGDTETINYAVSAFLPIRREATGVHIHLGEVGENGEIVMELDDRAQGRFSADDLVGPLAGAHKEDLIELMRSGGIYIDVHTERFPQGEIRGQIHGSRGRG